MHKTTHVNMEPIPGYKSWWLDIADHLGSIYPFYDATAQAPYVSLNLHDILRRRREASQPVALDTAALVTKALLPHLLGDRTLIAGVKRAPWLGRPQPDGEWSFMPLPPHAAERPDPDQFIRKWKTALLAEAERYVRGHSIVGILLSGGMDSRIVAGVVRALQLESDSAFHVVGLTWGDPRSRDVIYAQRVTNRFGWAMRHFPITAETLYDNIFNAVDLGAEVSALHLHALPQIARLDGVDVILAGSYGDSVGRAEFSGRHVTRLKPIYRYRPDRFAVIDRSVLQEVAPSIRADADVTRWLPEGETTLARREIEQEAQYMRRMLQACMMIVAERIPLFQLFTHPSVFGEIWKLDPTMRDNSWYTKLLEFLPGNLLDIPWARTGSRYGSKGGVPDSHWKSFHKYGTWLRREMHDEIFRGVESNRIHDLGVFCQESLNRALRAWKRDRTSTINALDELFVWLAGLDAFIERHELVEVDVGDVPSGRNFVRSYTGGMYANLYIQARNYLRD